jgi:hypothetical protein
MNKIKLTAKNIIPLYNIWEAYWDSDYNITNQDGYVKSWGSIINNYSLYQSTKTARPSIVNNFISSRNAINFDGYTQWFNHVIRDNLTTIPNASSGIGFSPFSIIAQISTIDIGSVNNKNIITWQSPAGSNLYIAMGFQKYINTYPLWGQFYNNPSLPNVPFKGLVNLSFNAEYIVAYCFDGTNKISIYINAVADSQNPITLNNPVDISTVSGQNTSNRLYVGGFSNSGTLFNPFPGKIRLL